ncbi:MAG: type III-B CRISPR module RAMP protein Cmr6 [Spirochaetaceae bacterium]|nr:type III-B CRISPR module RAMP protein Cmr6 [Spirochaetaceae bacterium]
MTNDKVDNAENPKLQWINDVTGHPVGSSEEIEEYSLRVVRLAEKRNGRWFVFSTSWRFVTGLGRSHPVENGFAWHSTLGTPYLPGSSIKGLVHAWVTLHAQSRSSCDELGRLLGSPGAVGGVAFLDAIPIKPVTLEADVMTPHYGGWTSKDRVLPGDWRSPTPIPFLTTAAATPFLFAIAPTRTDREQRPTAELDTVSGWLRSALALAGAGAKTAVGYGRFEQDATAQDELRLRLHARAQKIEKEVRDAREVRQREACLARLSPVEREIEELIAVRPNKSESAFIFIMGHMQRNRWTGDAKVEAATWLETTMKRENRWKERSGAKNPAKDRTLQRTLLVKRWLAGE